jgi:geranylgeranyl pyrophosphate synthase
VLEIFRQKTAPAFQVALQLGAIFAGGKEDVHQVLEHYSEALGVAYQIRDDLEDFLDGEDTAVNCTAVAPGVIGAPAGDGKASRPSLLLALAHQRAAGQERELLERLWRRQEDFDKIRARLGAIFAKLGVEQDARGLLELYKQRAIGSLGLLEDVTLKGLLRRVISKIFDDTGTMACCWEHKAADARYDEGVGKTPA